MRARSWWYDLVAMFGATIASVWGRAVGLACIASCAACGGGDGLAFSDGRYGGAAIGFSIADGSVVAAAACELPCEDGQSFFGMAVELEAPFAVDGESVVIDPANVDLDVVIEAELVSEDRVEGDWRLGSSACPAPAAGAFQAVRFPEGAPDDAPLCGRTLLSGCSPLPEETPVQVCEQDVPLHWDLDEGCVPFTLPPEDEAVLAELRAAFAMWDEIECSQLCFEDAGIREDASPPPPLEANIDVRMFHGDDEWNVDHAPSSRSLATVIFGAESCEVRSASIDLRLDDYGDLVVYEIGHALGLERPVINADGTISDETAAALCVLYGPQPLCGGFKLEGLEVD